jgi:hypothetical protein
MKSIAAAIVVLSGAILWDAGALAGGRGDIAQLGGLGLTENLQAGILQRSHHPNRFSTKVTLLVLQR